MTPLLFICFLALFIYSTCKSHAIKKHDGVLFPFCALRGDLASYLMTNVLKNPGAISKREGAAAFRLFNAVNATIDEYDNHKTLLFNMHTMVKYLKKYHHLVKQAAPLDKTDNAEIQAFHSRFAYCLAKAFLAYTPLIRFELMLRLSANAYRAGFIAGKKARERRLAAEYVIRNSAKVRDDARRYGLLTGTATS